METRMQKYKEYRASLISQGAKEAKEPVNTKTLTSTLPLDEVMVGLDNSDKDTKLIKIEKRNKIIKFSLVALFFVLLIIGVVFLGLFVFRS